ncbi:MAG: DUF6173 family protein [Sulfitobacter sp.]|nr:DUF6173 family protein [Sulfitobacter sp.]
MDEDIRTTAEAIEADALPRLYEAHANKDEQAKSGDQDLPAAMTKKPARQKSPAQWAYERTVLYLKKFEEQLDNEQEAAMGFAGSDAGVLRIEGMGYFDPDVLTFYGRDPRGGRMQLVQHVSQLNVVLRAVPKAVENEAPARIGFRLMQDLEENETDPDTATS